MELQETQATKARRERNMKKAIGSANLDIACPFDPDCSYLDRYLLLNIAVNDTMRVWASCHSTPDAAIKAQIDDDDELGTWGRTHQLWNLDTGEAWRLVPTYLRERFYLEEDDERD